MVLHLEPNAERRKSCANFDRSGWMVDYPDLTQSWDYFRIGGHSTAIRGYHCHRLNIVSYRGSSWCFGCPLGLSKDEHCGREPESQPAAETSDGLSKSQVVDGKRGNSDKNETDAGPVIKWEIEEPC
jgi:hypothetical protein